DEWMPCPPAVSKRSELQTARDAPVGELEEIPIEPLEARYQLCVTRVVVVPEPDAREENPVRRRCRAGDEAPAREALQHLRAGQMLDLKACSHSRASVSRSWFPRQPLTSACADQVTTCTEAFVAHSAP